jgi:hypothetical protein
MYGSFMKGVCPRAFNIFLVYLDFTIYRQYFFLKFEQFSCTEEIVHDIECIGCSKNRKPVIKSTFKRKLTIGKVCVITSQM